MAGRPRKKATPKVKFQVSKSGIAGIAVVCFCIFLWMFLLGVWAGQSLLFKAVDSENVTGAGQSRNDNKFYQPIILEAGKYKKKK